MRLTRAMRARITNYRAPTPITSIFSDSQVSTGYFGFFDTTTTAGRRNFDRSSPPAAASAVWAGYITGTSATLACASGDAAPYVVQVDGGAEVTPTISGGKISLFSGLSDTPHLVQIRSDNSDTGQSVPTSGELFSVTGLIPTVNSIGASFYVKDPSFPGVETFLEAAPKGGNWLPAYRRPVTSAGFGASGGSLHFRTTASDVWIFCALTEVWFSKDGGTWTRATLAANAPTPGGLAKTWKKIPALNNPGMTQYELIISSSVSSGDIYVSGGQIEGVMIEGNGATISAPSTVKTIVTLFGASQVQGVGATIGSVDINRLQPYIPSLAAAQNGNAGATIAQAITAFPTWAAANKSANKQTIILSIGINSADDANFQPDYQSLINAALTAGFAKVICRGLVLAGDTSSKNAKIQAAVTAINDPRVVYASVSTWSASTTDLGGLSIWMPDGAHPNDVGYERMAQLMLRDHSSLLP